MSKIDFKTINEQALSQAESVISRLLPKGRRQGNEWIGFDPNRGNSVLGSLSINLANGVWVDFSTQHCDRCLISLVAYIEKVNYGHAAIMIANFLGIKTPIKPASKHLDPPLGFKDLYPPAAKDPAKIARVLHYLYDGGTLNRFEAAYKLHDTGLKATISTLRNDFGIDIQSELEAAKGDQQLVTTCKRYTLSRCPSNLKKTYLLLVKRYGYRPGYLTAA